MNDRPQGGSSLFDGQIEFMQNRRIPADDSRGMGEWLDEKDSNGNGIRVPATYYVQLFNRTFRHSVQRLVQHKTDNPVQYFFTRNITFGDKSSVESSLSKNLKAAGVVDTVKLLTFPIDHNQILLRLTNLYDPYDLQANDPAGTGTYKVDLEAIVASIYESATGETSCPAITFTEMTLGANMKLSDLNSRRIHWKTVDDVSDAASPLESSLLAN